MPLRVIAFFLAFALFWSGVSTIEAPRDTTHLPAGQQHAIGHAGGPGSALQGSVDDHHLDDLPAQAQSDPPADAPVLLPSPLAPRLQGGSPARARALAAVALTPPCLAGPLRPPCDAVLAG
jgi:hypothetical protein